MACAYRSVHAARGQGHFAPSPYDEVLAEYADALYRQRRMPAIPFRFAVTLPKPQASELFQEAMFAQRIPVAAIQADDLATEFARLTAKGVVFTQAPMDARPGESRRLR